MSTKAPFSGISILSPGESLATDGYAFQGVDRQIIDGLLKLGALTHKHDAHAALGNPTIEPTVETDPANGSIPASTTVGIVYTLIDTYGGETLPSPVVTVTTDSPMDGPLDQPDFEVAAGGTIRPGTYYYALTLTDDGGGETEAGPPITVDVDAGAGNAQIVFSGFAEIVEAVPGATGWKLYKATEVGAFHQITTGSALLDTFTDDGTLCADCTANPPSSGNTNGTNSVTFVVPSNSETTSDDVVNLRVYVGVGGDFTSPALWGILPKAQLGILQRVENLTLGDGAPPDVATTIQGAAQIDPDTDLLDWNWKRPVATYNDLPEGVQGDIRLALDTGRAWVVLATTAIGPAQWSPLKASGPLPSEIQQYEITFASGGDYKLLSGSTATGIIPLGSDTAAVQAALDAILGAGNTVVTSLGANHFEIVYANDMAGIAVPPLSVDTTGLTGPGPVATTTVIVHGGMGGHLITNDGGALASRTKLKFTGTGVTVEDDEAGDATVVTITGGGGGGDGGGGTGFPGVEYSQSPETAIPDAGGGAIITAPISVAESAVIGTDTDFPELRLYLTHPFVNDLTITLVGPDLALYDVVVEDGPNVALGTGFDADNWAIVSPYAAIVMNDTTPSYVGRVKPSDSNVPEPWAGMTGKNITGDWKLRIEDMSGGDVGVLHDWGLNFTAGLVSGGDTVTIDIDSVLEFRDGPFGALKGKLEVINTAAGGWPIWTLRARMYEDDGTEHIIVLATSESGHLVDSNLVLAPGDGLTGYFSNPSGSVLVYAKDERVYLDFDGAGTTDGITDVLAVPLTADLRPRNPHEIWVPYRVPVTDAGGLKCYGEFWSLMVDGTIKREPNTGVMSPEIHAHVSWRRT